MERIYKFANEHPLIATAIGFTIAVAVLELGLFIA